MKVLLENIETLVYVAIKTKEEEEHRISEDYKSALRAGWEEIQKAIEEGDRTIQIVLKR